MPKFCLTLLDRDRRFMVRGSGAAALPPGTYELLSYSAETTDEKGDRWSVQWYCGENPLTVNTHKRNLKFGPPFQATVEAKSYNGFIGLGVVITGRAGECYSLDDFRKNGALVTPYVRVSDEKGVTVAEGPSLEHGSDYISESFQWYPKETQSGTYTATPVVDYGPLELSIRPIEFDVVTLLKRPL